MKITRWLVGGVGLLVLIALIGGALLLLNLRLPSISRQPAPNSIPLTVTIVDPPNNSRWPANAYVPVMATIASAAPIASVELWAGETLVESKSPEATNVPFVSIQWAWAPGRDGEHDLVVRAQDAEGRTGTSNVIHIMASAPVGMRLAVDAKAGDTLASLAVENKIDLQKVATQNPGLDPSRPLPAGQRVFLPVDPLPVPASASAPTGQGVPPPGDQQLPLPGGVSPPTGADNGTPATPSSGVKPGAGPVKPVGPRPSGSLPGLDTLPGIIGRGILPGMAKKPAVPELYAAATGCDVDLRIVDRSDNEDGFFVYRVDSGSPAFQRIAALPANSDPLPMQYTDKERSGTVQYYVSSFNSVGESPSKFAGVALAAADCPPAPSGTAPVDSSGMRFEDGRLVLPHSADIAYFYISLNGGASVRVPEDPKAFFTPQEGHVVDLHSFTEKMSPPPGATKLEVDLEVWGWSGGGLVYLGKLHTTLDRTRLTVCNLGKNCTGDIGSTHRVKEANVASDKQDQKTEFYWDTIAPQTTAILWQVSTSPFPAEFSFQPPNLVGASTATGTRGGSFLIDFANLHKPPERISFANVKSGLDKQGALNRFSLAKGDQDPLFELIKGLVPSFTPPTAWMSIYPITYYVRATPMSGTQPAGKPSDTVKIVYGPLGPPPTVQIMTHLPNIFQVEILADSYEPPRAADPNLWGCVIIKSVDPAAFNQYPEGSIFHNTEKYLYDFFASKIGWMGCPAAYEEPSWWDDVMGFFEQFFEALKSMWNAAVSAFNAIKATVVQLAADIISALPGIECGETCKGLLSTGLDMAITSLTGLPPNLPNFDDLANMGMDYAIELAAAEAGVPCPDECKNVLKDGLKEVVKAAKARGSQPGCVGEGFAKMYGKKPFCLPPGVTTEPVIEGTNRPAHANVKVTRLGTADTTADPNGFLMGTPPSRAYALRVTVTGINEALAGKSIGYTYTYYVPSMGGQGYPDTPRNLFFSVGIDGPLEADLYKPQSVPLPLLSGGQSVTIPFAFERNWDYYIPEHVVGFYQALANTYVDDTVDITELIKGHFPKGKRPLTPEDVGGLAGSAGLQQQQDYNCLYNSGKLRIEAKVMCLDFPNGQIYPGPDSKLVECGSKAVFEVSESVPQAYCPAY
ncbi:MAG: hypothetical protein M1370_12465 [Bacteroidetes bacterium]|nr:hypothetical protein [Bacteroidota bacterium]